MMKTAMEQLIRKIELLQMADAVIDPLDIVKMFATELIETEKKQIVEAYRRGKTDALTMVSGRKPTFEYAEEYFNNTYKK